MPMKNNLDSKSRCNPSSKKEDAPVVSIPPLKKQKAVSPKPKKEVVAKPKQVPKKEVIAKPKKVPKKTVAKPVSGGLSAWRSHLLAYKNEHPDVSLKVAMTECKKTYKRE